MIEHAALCISCLALIYSLQMSGAERHEYQFYLNSFAAKIGTPITWRQRLASWNAAKGGPAPKWHWIPPVVSPYDQRK